jgi:hypothetical protein
MKQRFKTLISKMRCFLGVLLGFSCLSSFLAFSSFAVASAEKSTNEVTCYIEGTLTQLFFDGRSVAEGRLNTGELVVARSIEWSDADMPALSTLETIAMKAEFPFRLEREGLDCEIYHPSRWWFNQPEVMEALKSFAPESATEQ